jgi:phosphoesterase RecJ-like protein
MKNLTRADCADYLERYDHYCILTHRRPDGDTVGSAAALCRMLRAMDKTAHVLSNPETPERYQPLLEGLTCNEPADGDKIVAVDVAEDVMLPKAFSYLRNSIDLKIDHHGSGREYAPNSLVDPESAACAEIIWDILDELGLEMDEKMAEAIYVGTATDTGCFRFANTNAHTFDVAADCAAAGADIFSWNLRLFETNSLPKLRLQAWVVDNFKLLCDGKIALCALPDTVEEELGVGEDDMNNISGFLRSIEGVCVAALLRNAGPENTKVSVRSIPGYNAASICEIFGGGGHAGAAGCSIRMPLAQAAEAMEKTLIEWERS